LRATVRLGLACNNRCIFCCQDGLDTPDVRSVGEEVTFVGGEPLLHEDLVDRVREARGKGARAVGVQTNGHRLAELAAPLARAGLTDVHVSIHGAEAAVHDYHTGVDGSFERLLQGAAAARAEGLLVVATTVLTRSNFRGLGMLARLLHQRGIQAWNIAVPEVAGRASASFDRVIPRLGMALPFALHAATLARTLGIHVYFSGAPLCLIHPNPFLPSPPRAYAAVCEGCEARPNCPGVDARYLARFDGDELRPRYAWQPTRDRLAELFVGPGELAAAAVEKPAASPAAARRQLPLYGKVVPAAGEASPAAPKKSGEALRDLFPQLFDGEE
jgi:hypothetical protein